LIDGVIIRPLVRHADERGYVMEILRDDDPDYQRFGQVYVSTCYPGVVKAWHAHTRQTDYFCVVKGNAKIGLWDRRPGSPTQGQTMSVVIGEHNPCLVVIPPGVWHGQMAVGTEMSVLVNVPTEHYDRESPDELRADPFTPEAGFQWRTEGR
jgi:dTDP-4-dehydrorhamnose 3,5-epimerase